MIQNPEQVCLYGAKSGFYARNCGLVSPHPPSMNTFWHLQAHGSWRSVEVSCKDQREGFFREDAPNRGTLCTPPILT